MTRCEAYQSSDQMCCTRCGMVWDMNDPEPPECQTDQQIARDKGIHTLHQIKEELKDEQK